MSFENYLGRMRLIGLGFAHAYTQNSFDQLRFLRRISEISADAMRESALSLEAIGDWPDFEVDSQYATVPTLLDKSLTEARQLADRAKLKLEVGDPEYDGDKEINTVIDQKPAPGLYVSKDTKIRVTPSTNKLPNVEVPDFTAKTVLEAIELAQQKGFEIEPIDFEFSDAEEGNVINQDLRAGLNVTMRTTLKLTVAKKKEVVDEDGT